MPTLNSHTHCQVAPADPQAKTWQRVCLFQPATDRQSGKKKNTERTTRVWQKWRFSAPQTHLWLTKIWFSASTFVVKIATFAKRKTVMCNKKRN
jgi:hypothetical protein